MAPLENFRKYRWLVVAGRLLVVSWFMERQSFGASPPPGLVGAETLPLTAIEAAERLDVLRTEIASHDELYFKKAAPVISDQAYDQLKRELAALELAFPDAAREGSAVDGMGDDRTGSFVTQRHRVRMLSLNKSYTETELRAFDARLTRQLGRRELDYVVEPKFDGLAISVTFEKGKLVRAVTRGNGAEGDEVTANVLTIRSLPQTLKAESAAERKLNPMPDLVELRGEIFISYPEFARINRERESAGEAPFANPRNLAAGTLKQSDLGLVAQRRLEIVFYGCGACEPAEMRPDSQQALLRQFRAWGLPTVEAPRVVRGADAMWRAVQALGRERPHFNFPTDGAVVKLDAVALQEKIGVTAQAPLWAMAYKFATARAETQLRAITLQVGRTGVLTPVAELVPVRLGGSTNARASLFNGDEIIRRDIRVGDFVYVEKAGEIIPVIAGVNRARRGAETKPYVFPAVCPNCQGNLVRPVAEAAWRCPNSNCPAQVKRRVEHFASTACLAISGLGPATVDKLVQHGWVKNVADLYRLRREDLLSLGSNTGKSTDHLLRAIEQSKHAPLWRFIFGLGIPQVGEVASRALAQRFGGLVELMQASPEDFLREGRPMISGIGESTSRAIVAHFSQSENRTVVGNLLAFGIQPTVEISKVATRTPSAGLFVLNSNLPSPARAGTTTKLWPPWGEVVPGLNRESGRFPGENESGFKIDSARRMSAINPDASQFFWRAGRFRGISPNCALTWPTAFFR